MGLDRVVSVRSDLKIQSPYLVYSRTLPTGDSSFFFPFNNEPDTLIIQIYSTMKLYMFRTTSLPIIRSSVLYIRHW